MIKIESQFTHRVKGSAVDVGIEVEGMSDDVTKELAAILQSFDERFPDIFMNAIELHIKHLFKEGKTLYERKGKGDNYD